MSRLISSLVLVLIASIVVAGCAGGPAENPKTTVGALGGAAAGGLIGAAAAGHSPAAIAGGVILGGLAGGAVGNLLDQRDRQLAAQTAQRALETAPTGTVVPWTNPDNGHAGVVTPVRTYQVADGGYCREYQQVVTVGNQQQEAYGTACRQPDGSWRVTN
jgi:surface antigen